MKIPKLQRDICMNSKKSLAKTKHTVNAIINNQYIDKQGFKSRVNWKYIKEINATLRIYTSCKQLKKTMGLSPSTLFHLTNKKGLKGILKDNFHLSYSIESIPSNEGTIKLGVPMVSFSDIKISEIKEHCDKYGYYGIGLTKEWAYEKGLNQVIYQNLNSEFAKNIISFIRKQQNDKTLPFDERIKVIDFLRFTKQYEGKLNRKSKNIQNYRFADEREWRYVPKYNSFENFEDYLPPEKFANAKMKKEQNDNLKNEKLYFNANQIMYLIVKEEKEIDEIIRHIQNVKGEKYSHNDVSRLTTRIISYERILNDI